MLGGLIWTTRCNWKPQFERHCVLVFFYLEKTYDTTWRWGIPRNLFSYGIRGRMLHCVKSFLSSRTFRVRVGNTLSRISIQVNDVPQGAVLSVTLFAVKINSLCKVVPPAISCWLFVDGFQISLSSCNLSRSERQLQLIMNRMTKWADENGFKFSSEKNCLCSLLCSSRIIS